VVALTSPRGLCSGALIYQSGEQAWVLTAAHCLTALGPELVVQRGNEVYPVVEAVSHPLYSNQAVYDVALVRVNGVNGPISVLPIATSEEVKPGQAVHHIGYGRGSWPNGAFGALRSRDGVIASVHPLTLRYEDGPDGPCQGDSGGPDIEDGEVIGVMSQSDAQCREWVKSTRVSALYASFIAPTVFGTPATPVSCAQCQQAATQPGASCSAARLRCVLDEECAPVLACIETCGTTECRAECIAASESAFEPPAACLCQGACTTECRADPVCR
jgi:hypothetical protein